MNVNPRISFSFKLVICLFFVITEKKSFAQENEKKELRIVIIDSVFRKGLSNVSVFVYNKDCDKLLETVITDSQGLCKISPAYSDSIIVLEVYHEGYRIKRSDLIYMKNSITHVIPITSLVKELKEVTVVREYTSVTVDKNIFRYNLKAVPNYESMTTLDVLNSLPYLSVDENVIKMMGQPIVILINNKTHPYLSNPQNLNTLPPQAIEKIEVNFVPTARSGLQKVMNISLKKDYFLGWTGNLNMGGSWLGFNPSASLGYWTNKLGFNLSANYNYVDAASSSISRSESDNAAVNQIQRNKNIRSAGSLFGSLFYNIDSLSIIDFQWVHSGGKTTSGINSDIDYKKSGFLTGSQYSTSQILNNNNNNTIALSFTRKFRKSGKEFYLLSQFNSGPSGSNNNTILYSNVNQVKNVLSDQVNFVGSVFKDLTIEALLQNNQENKIQYTVGAKMIRRWSESNLGLEQKYYQPDSTNSSTAFYKFQQTVINSYGDITIRLKKELILNTGVKFEYVRSAFIQQTRSAEDYRNFIPNVSLTFNFNSSSVVSASYSRNVLRPGFSSLIPFKNIQNAYLKDSGNIDLQPQYDTRWGIQYYGNSGPVRYGTEASFSQISNFIDAFYSAGMNGAIIQTLANSQNNIWSLSMNIDFSISKNIRFSHFCSGSIIDQAGQGFRNKLVSGYIQEKMFFTLSKKQRLYISTIAFSPNVTLQGKDQSMAYWNTRFAYSYYLLLRGNPAQLGLSIDNPWLTKGFPAYNEQKSPELNYNYRSYRENPYISLQFVLNFKGKKYKENSFSRSKSIQNNDIKENIK